MQIKFYTNFYKKNNSTKRPVAGGVLEEKTIDGYLKEPCSIMNPVVNFQSIPVSNSPHVLSYAYIPIFDRYYFVKDWVWNDGLWTCYMDVDVLATYKIDIGLQEEYILRTDSTLNPLDYDGAISDGMYPASTNFSIDQINFTHHFEPTIALGTYILGIISNEDSNAVGAITYYAMTASEFGTMKSVLLGASGLESMGLIQIVGSSYEWLAQDMSEQIFKTMYNPYQYIASCMWFPVDKDDLAGTQIASSTGIPLGWWTFKFSGKRLSAYTRDYYDDAEQIPPHPLAPYRGKYLNYAPFTKLTLHGKFGSAPIDPSFLEVGDYIRGVYNVDLITGQCLYQVFIGANATGTTLVYKTEFLIGVPIQIAQIGRDYLGMVSNAIQAGSGLVTGAVGGLAGGLGGAIIGALAGGADAIINTIDASMPQLQTSGINGSFIELDINTQLTVYHYAIVDEDIEHRGRPLCQKRQLNTLHGYILCAEGDLDINAFDAERQEIARFLTTGFFWE